MNFYLVSVTLHDYTNDNILHIEKGIRIVQYLPHVPPLHISPDAHSANPQLQVPALQTSPVAPFALQGSGEQGSFSSKQKY